MSVHRYAPPVADLARGGIALAGALAALAGLDLARPVAVVMWLIAILFASFLMQTLARGLSRIELSDDALILSGPRRATLRWQDLTSVRLSYYSTRRDRRGGWLTMRLKGGGRSVRIDSTLDGFETILARTARAARDNGLDLDHATRVNLAGHDQTRALGTHEGA